MNKLKRYFALSNALSIVAIVALAASAFGQNPEAANNIEPAKEQSVNAAPSPIVDARQSGEWTVGIDPAKNSVRLFNTPADPLPVKIIGSGSPRTPFQKRVIVRPLGNAFQTVFMPIPAGKRLVIENISAIVRCADGQRMEVNYFTYFDNEGNGDGGIADITFHRVALTDQGVFDGTAIFTANHKVVVFAEEKIGAFNYQVGVQARLNGPVIGDPQAQLTFSGYLEDLPAVP